MPTRGVSGNLIASMVKVISKQAITPKNIAVGSVHAPVRTGAMNYKER